MNILLDNVDLNSNTGPNSFGKKIRKYLGKLGCGFAPKYDVQLSFITRNKKNTLPLVLRLDGIYFNSAQNYEAMNSPIKASYRAASNIIFQTEFNKKLIFKYFGDRDNTTVIPNGADLSMIYSVNPAVGPLFDRYEQIWVCASQWRPHKRLKENISYFLEHSTEKDCLFIAGKTNKIIRHNRIIFLGELPYEKLLSLYKRANHFIHLAWLDHCPNVVVDARACGCKIICSTTGGTKEIAGLNSILIGEDEWGFNPVDLYSPPDLDFTRRIENKLESDLDMNAAAKKYYETLKHAKNQ